MILLVSEICRLILGFLEDEKFPRTYETFLDECKYLEECRVYIDRGLTFPKKIHGKDLIQYLNLTTVQVKTNSSVFCQTIKKSTNTISTQTDSTKTNQIRPTLRDSFAQTDPHHRSKPTHSTFREIPKINQPVSYLKKRPYKTRSKKPIESKEQIPSVENVETINLDESLDLDNFIQNLCSKDFAQKLAEGINEMNAKKLNMSLDSSQIEIISNETSTTNSKFDKLDHSEINQTVVENKQSPDNNIIQNMETEDQQNQLVNQEPINNTNIDLNPADDSKFFIGNDEISLLAEHFSEPAFEALFDLISSHKEPNEQQLEPQIEITINHEIPCFSESNVSLNQTDKNINQDVNINLTNNEILEMNTNVINNEVSEKITIEPVYITSETTNENNLIQCSNVIELDKETIVETEKFEVEDSISDKIIINETNNDLNVSNTKFTKSNETQVNIEVDIDLNDPKTKDVESVQLEPQQEILETQDTVHLINNETQETKDIETNDLTVEKNNDEVKESSETSFEFRFSDEEMTSSFQIDESNVNINNNNKPEQKNQEEKIKNDQKQQLIDTVVETNTIKDNIEELSIINTLNNDSSNKDLDQAINNLKIAEKHNHSEAIDLVNETFIQSEVKVNDQEEKLLIINLIKETTVQIVEDKQEKDELADNNIQETSCKQVNELNDDLNLSIESDKGKKLEKNINFESSQILDIKEVEEEKEETKNENSTLILEDENESINNSFVCEPYDEKHNENIKSAIELLDVLVRLDKKEKAKAKLVDAIFDGEVDDDDNSSQSNKSNKKLDKVVYSRGETGSFIIIGRNQKEVLSLEQQLKSINKLNDNVSSNSNGSPIQEEKEKQELIENIESTASSSSSNSVVDKNDEQILGEDSNGSSSYSLPPTPFLKQTNTIDDLTVADDENVIVESDLNLSAESTMSPTYSSQLLPKTPTKPTENENSKSSNFSSSKQFKKAISFQCSFKDIFTNKFKLNQIENKLKELEESKESNEINKNEKVNVNVGINQQLVINEITVLQPIITKSFESQNNVINQIEEGEISDDSIKKNDINESTVLGLNVNDCFEVCMQFSQENQETQNKTTSTPTKNKDLQKSSIVETNTNQEEILSESLSYSSSSSTHQSPTRTSKTPEKINTSSNKTNNNNNIISTDQNAKGKKETELNIDEILQLVKPTSLITKTVQSNTSYSNYSKHNTLNSNNNPNSHKTRNDQLNPSKKQTIRDILDSKVSTESILRASSSPIVFRPENNYQKRNDSLVSSSSRKTELQDDSKYNKNCSRPQRLTGSELKRKREYFDDFMRDDYESSKRALKTYNLNESNCSNYSTSSRSSKRSDSRDRASSSSSTSKSTSSSSSNRFDRYNKQYSSYSRKNY